MKEELVLSVADASNIDSLEMGVLPDGATYLTGRGLARVCGVSPSAIITQAQRWKDGDRTSKFAQIMVASGYTADSLSLPLQAGAAKTLAFPEPVCMAFLDYYAYEATPASEQAKRTHRMVARAGLRLFVYNVVGYDPQKQVPLAWRQFHDRLRLHQVPRGFFNVFHECADFVLSAIRRGLIVDDHTIPDISVGMLWGQYWTRESLDLVHGLRTKAMHNYPDYFPQAKSNPQEIWVYPLAALGTFRIWLQDVYIPNSFPNYIKMKEAKGLIPPGMAELLLEEYAGPDGLTASLRPQRQLELHPRHPRRADELPRHGVAVALDAIVVLAT